jgi:teichuronic acid biosynthesis glycosyltransferase TuaG
MQNPLISVIVTTYNRKALLKETIDSILNQTYRSIEVIIVDNFSNYDFFEHIKSFNDSRIVAFQNQNNNIIAINRNFALKKAKGAYIAFCDDDDTWATEKLEKQMQQVQKSDNCISILVYTNANCFGEGIKEYPITNYRKKITTINDLFKHNSITLSSVLVSNSNMIYFEELPELKAVEDYFLWLNLVYNNHKVIFIDSPLVNYRVASHSVSNQNAKFGHIRLLLAQQLIILRYQDIKIDKSNFFFSTLFSLFKFLIKN